MGCCEQRDQGSSVQTQKMRFVVPNIQDLISEGSLDLPFVTLDPKQLISAIKSRSTKNTINLVQLHKALEQMKVSYRVIHYPNSSFITFLRILNSDISVFDARIICMAGILLSQSPEQKKLSLIFKLLDEQAEGNIQERQLEKFLENLQYICLDVLPSLISESTEHTKTANDYIEILYAGSENIKTKLKALVENGTISQDDFVQKMKNHRELKYIISPQGFRTIAYYYAGTMSVTALN